jgi:methyl-accepting chemotaxis protein
MSRKQFSISRLTTFGNLLLAGLILLLVTTTLWAIQALQTPYTQLLKYTAIATQVQTGLRKPMDEYLASGNALKLADAEKQLQTTVETDFAALPTKATSTAHAEAERLQNFMATELRAAGKLSGNEQGLLLQAEREMRFALSNLNDYAREGGEKDPGLALQYSNKVAHLLEILNTIAHVRQKYFHEHDNALRDQLLNSLKQAETEVTSLKQLPRLGIYLKEEEDDFSALLGGGESDAEQTAQEEKADAPLSNLSSQLSRYQKELEHTEEIIKHATEMESKARQQVNGFIDSLDSVVSAIDTRFTAISAQVETTVIAAGLLVLLMTGGLGFLQRQLIRAIQRLLPVLADFAQGNLRNSVKLDSRFTEINQLENSANGLRSQLGDLVAEIRREALDVDQLSNQLGSTIQMIHQGAETQVEQTEQSASAVNEMTASFREVADQAAHASEASLAANASANQGQTVIHSAIATIDGLARDIETTTALMESLAEESNKIDSVRSVIENIAEQTNLLALNAAIEAARAGEQGRGFAVVADEVRQLAQRTTESTQEIRNTIETLQQSTHSAVDTMTGFAGTAQNTTEQAKAAGQAFNEIVAFIDNMRDMTTTIAGATEQQAHAAGEIDHSIVHISDMGKQALDALNDAVERNQRLAQMSTDLLQSAQRFELQADG